jgi:hypothetical protein
MYKGWARNPALAPQPSMIYNEGHISQYEIPQGFALSTCDAETVLTPQIKGRLFVGGAMQGRVSYCKFRSFDLRSASVNDAGKMNQLLLSSYFKFVSGAASKGIKM